MGKKRKGKSKSGTTSTKDLKNDPNIFLGTGNFTLPNGDTYSGEYCAHRLGVIWRQGHGIYVTHDGQSYEGEWADDKLVDNSELVIKYPSGAAFHGRLTKNRYNGPGVYTLTNKMDISCQFTNNQPRGDVILIDQNGKLWRGEAQKDQAFLIPENIFYLLLPEDRGKGVSRTQDYEMATSSLGEEEEGSDFPDEYWRDLIFAKSTMTDADSTFTDSKWYKCFDKFKKRKAEIGRKIANDVTLDKEDCDWLERFKEYKDKCREIKADKELAKKMSSEAAFNLMETFRSPEFADSCREVKIYHKRTGDQELSSESSSSDSSSSGSSNSDDGLPRSKFDKSRLRSRVLVKKKPTDHSIHHILADTHHAHSKFQATRLMDEMEELFLRSTDVELQAFSRKQTVKFHSSSSRFMPGLSPVKAVDKKAVRHARIQRLHFTKKRKQLALQMRVQKILERKQADADQILFSHAKQMSEMEGWKQSQEVASVGSKSGLSVVVERKTPDAAVKSSVTTNAVSTANVVEDQQARINRYINERVQQWQNEEDNKKKTRAMKKVKPPTSLHLHSVGVYTDSLPDIPRDMLVRMV